MLSLIARVFNVRRRPKPPKAPVSEFGRTGSCHQCAVRVYEAQEKARER